MIYFLYANLLSTCIYVYKIFFDVGTFILHVKLFSVRNAKNFARFVQ